MKHLVIGLGEVGKSLREVLDADGVDWVGLIETKDPVPPMTYDMIHICFPYSESFEEDVRKYIQKFIPSYTVIHSTVPIGTCAELGVAHSPIRGQHPYLTDSIKTFIKYVAGSGAREIAEEFERHGMKTRVLLSSNDSEAGKLLDLMQYGASILLNKEIFRFCDENEINFNISYTDFNDSYNEGYKKMGAPQYIRPNLRYMAGKIGGHCVVPMMELLESPTAKKILEENEKL